MGHAVPQPAPGIRGIAGNHVKSRPHQNESNNNFDRRETRSDRSRFFNTDDINKDKHREQKHGSADDKMFGFGRQAREVIETRDA